MSNREAVLALVDRTLLDRIERRATALKIPEPRDLSRLRAPRMHLDPEAWKTGFVRVEERELPPELYRDLKELTPQALLRDLYRPERQSIWHERIPLEQNV